VDIIGLTSVDFLDGWCMHRLGPWGRPVMTWVAVLDGLFSHQVDEPGPALTSTTWFTGTRTPRYLN